MYILLDKAPRLIISNQYCYELFGIIPSKIFLEIYTGKEIEEEWTTTDLEVIIKDQLYLQSELLEWNASKNIKH